MRKTLITTGCLFFAIRFFGQRVGLGWQKLQYITDPAGNANDLFGGSTAIDGSNKRFLIGVPGYVFSSGRAVFGEIN